MNNLVLNVHVLMKNQDAGIIKKLKYSPYKEY